MNFVFFATRWGRAFGGLNAFNQQFVEGLAKRLGPNHRLFCAILDPSDGAISEAAFAGVTLIPIRGQNDVGKFEASWRVYVAEWLAGNAPNLAIDYWVGHDVVSGQVAVEAARAGGGQAVLIHHMSYASYHGLKGDARRAEAKAQEQRALFANDAVLFGVGPLLVTKCKTLAARVDVHQLTPGFTAQARPLTVEHDTVRAIMFGRLDADSDIVKQGRLAAAAFGAAVRVGREQELAVFRNPSLHLYGVDEKDADAFRGLVNAEAGGRPINVLPLPFADRPDDLFATLGRANLALMVSLHDGFGLSGWEAIGAEAPLIVGEDTGLYRLVDESLLGAGEGCLRMVEIKGGVGEENFHPDDQRVVADAILAIGRNLDKAKARAQTLRRILVEKLGCEWTDTAREFLAGLDAHASGGATSARGQAPPPPAVALGPVAARATAAENRVPRCADVNVGAAQGSTAQDIGLLAEVRFGEEILEIDGMQVAYGVSRAALTLHLRDCDIKPGRRLGDSKADSPDVAAHPSNRWVITGPRDGAILSRKALGDEILCTLEASAETCGVDLVLSCEKRDIHFAFLDPEGEALGLTKQAVIEVFLSKCLAGDSAIDGGVHLSRVSLDVGGVDDAA